VRATTLLGQGWRFARGYRDLARHPMPLDDARRLVVDQLERRDERFLEGLDELVWPYAHSPARRLLECAGIGRDDVAKLVADLGLDASLVTLRDAGVYVAYEEATGAEPARRGSQTLEFRPSDFANPRVAADFLVSTGATTGPGTLSQTSFAYARRSAPVQALRAATWGACGVPTAVWMAAFPGAGMGTVLRFTAAGNPPERWFSQVPLSLPGVAGHKRLANRLLDVAGAVTGGLPRPEFVPPHDPSRVIDWAVDALRRGPAFIVSYASSGAQLGAVARDRGISLEGLVVSLGGEPVTAAKLEAVRASGAHAAAGYAFTPEATVAASCPHTPPEEFHVWDATFGLVSRPRPRADGVVVPALCFTSLSPEAPRVLLNVENDDYGDVTRDVEPCDCLLGQIGMRTRVGGVRGLSKVVAGGATLSGAVLERLAGELLPAAFGGGPADYQFVEQDRDGPTVVSLRVDPRLGQIDERRATDIVRSALRETDAGLLASAVWATIPVVRDHPVPTAGGKLLAFHRLSRTVSR
jgi:hypothetical protein